MQKNNGNKRISREYLFNYFYKLNYFKDDVNKMFESLSEEEMLFLKEVYGVDLTYNKRKLDVKDASKLNNLFTKMKKILKLNSEKVIAEKKIVEIDSLLLEKLYIYMSNHDFVSIDALKKEGYSEEVIATLVDKDILNLDSNLNYSLSKSQVDNLFRLSKIKGSVGDNISSFLFIKKCSQIEPNNDTFKFLVFAKSISANQNIEEIMKYFDVLSSCNKYQNDLDFYLLLLSYSYQLPKKYVDRLYSMNFNDIASKDKNSIRTTVFLGRIPYAYKMVNLKLQEKGKNAYLVLTKYLLQLAIHNYYDMNLKVSNLLKEEKYQEIIKIYDNISNSRPLNNREIQEKRLTEALIKNIDIIPKDGKVDYNTWLEALKNDDIEAAYKIVSSKDINKGKYLYLILEKLTARKKQKNEKIDLVTRVSDEQVVSSDNVIDAKKVVFGEVVTTIFNDSLHDILKMIYQYLSSYDKVDYFDVIVDYMKLSLLKGEKYYESVLPLISNLETLSSKININDIVQKFYEALSLNQLVVANVYLQLIIDLKTAGICLMSDSDISKLKLSSSNLYSKTSSVSVLDTFVKTVNEFSKNLSSRVIMEETIVDCGSSKEDVVVSCSGEVESVKEKIPTEKQVLEVKTGVGDMFNLSSVFEKIKTISDDHIIVLEPMSSDKRKKVHKALQRKEDIMTFSIGKEDNRSIVVKRLLPQVGEDDFRKLVNDANNLFRKGNYEEAVEKFLELLDLGVSPFNIARNCYNIGLCYNNIKKYCDEKSEAKLNRKLAVKYLTISNEIAKTDKTTAEYFNGKDLDTIILYAGDQLEKDDIKPKVRMREGEFYLDDSYKDLFDNYDYMMEQVLSGQVSIDDIGNIYNLSKEDEVIFELLVARELYKLDYPKMADEIISDVEKEKNKTKNVKSLYDEIVRRKRFYKYNN